MQIQVNTDNNIEGHQGLASAVIAELERSMARFAARITRIEVHLLDVNAQRGGANDKRCTLEARLAGENPIAVTNSAGSIEDALAGARDKLTRVLEKHVSRQRPPKGRDPFDNVSSL